jgi:hypothetical protein
MTARRGENTFKSNKNLRGIKMNRKRFYRLLILAVLTAVLSSVAFAQERASNKVNVKKRDDLTGVWLVNLDCGCGSPSSNGNAATLERLSQMQKANPVESARPVTLAPFNTVETFHADGTFAENSLIDYIQPQGTPGRGLWERNGNGEFNLTLYAVLIGSAANPEFQGTYRVRSRITTNELGDQFSGTGRVEIFDPSGNLVFSFDTPVQGRRAPLDPLQ